MVLDTGLNWTPAVLPRDGVTADVRHHGTATHRRIVEEQPDHLAVVLASISDAVVVVDRLGDVLVTNAAYERLPFNDGGTWTLLDSDGEPVTPDATPLQRAARGESVDLDLLLVGPAQSERLLQVKVRPIPDRQPGSAVGIVVIRDLGERPTQGLEERLVALLGHELRAPVSSLRNHAELLVRYLDDDLESEQAQKAIRRIYGLSGRLGLMIQDLFEMARISAGKLQVRQELIDPVDVVMSAVETAEALPDTPTIRVETAPDVPALRGDARRLSGVVLNLLTNAAKHAHNTPRIDVRVRIDGDAVAIDVQDYGPGIPLDDVPFILTKYYQARRATTTDQRGTRHGDGLGLGLFIAQEIVGAHGGRISVVSEPAAGARFTIHLPYS